MEREAFNSQFEIFQGDIKGAQIRALVSRVIASNATYIEKQVEIKSTDDIVTMAINATYPTYGTNFNNNQDYNVTLIYGTSETHDGIVESIIIRRIK